MDWHIFHLLNSLLLGHNLMADGVEDFSLWSVPMLAAATIGLWFVSRPGARSRWRMASLSALTAAAVALALNQAIAHIWLRARPSAAHPDAVHLYFVAPSHDPSFPSDHASAAFAIAFAVFFISRRAGLGFLLAAAAIGIARVLIGLHYPGDIAAGVLVGLTSATLVHVVANRPIAALADGVGRITDVVLTPLWRAAGGRRSDPGG